MRRFLDVRPAGPSSALFARFSPGRFLLSALLLATLAWPIGLGGQNIRDLGIGDRVRVTPSEGASVKGSFQELGPVGLTVLDSSANPFVIPISSLRTLEVAAGRRRGIGAVFGGGVGLVAGVLIGAATSGDCVGDCDDPYGVGGGDLAEASAVGMGALLGGVILGGVGAGIGAVFFAPERWVTIDLDSAGRITPMVRLRR